MNSNHWLITLSADEEALARNVALARNESQRQGNRKDGKVVADSLGIDIQGACAEMAVSKVFQLDWDGKFFELDRWMRWRVEGHDVSGLEVRSTHHQGGSLILHPKDPDYSPFILVLTHKKPTYIITGWAYGFEGKKKEYWKDVGYGRPCYYLPQNKLRNIEELHLEFKREVTNDTIR
jgi:hypothetical protein